MKATLFAIILIAGLISPAKAQEEQTDSSSRLQTVEEKVEKLQQHDESMNEIMLEMKSYIDLARKLKISGYMQTQYQSSDGIGNGSFPIGNFSGGTFPVNVGSRFQVRRGRLKIQYENDITFSQYVLQFDVTQNGLGIKDAYINLKDPWTHDWNLRMGVFDRPFGFEVAYSSNMRETPERSRMAQTLFPGERELGAMIEFQPEFEPWSNYSLKLGLFNGVLPTGNENDNSKDIIGRAGIIIPFEEYHAAVDGGVSLYYGGVKSNSKFIYTMNDGANGFSVDSTITNSGRSFDRRYIGGDIQIIYDMPLLGGISVRAEYITGSQPGAAGTNTFYNPSAANTPLFQRKFYGYYVSLLQNIGTQHQLLLRYDVLDPNTEINGAEIGTAGTTTIGDIQYSTIGFGYLYHFDENVKFTLFYEMPSNERVNANATGTLAPYTKDVKDDIFTFRIQYRFPY